MNGVLNLGWWVALGGVKFGGVFVLNCDCGSGKMKCAVKKMVGDEGLVGRLTAVSNHCSSMGPTKSKKKLSNEKLKICAKWVESGNLGILSDEWWVMSDENWVISDE